MTPTIQWDKCEPSVSADGTPLIRYAISDHDGVRLELSMDDATITKLIDPSLRFAVMSFPTNNAKIDPIVGGGFVALLKVGKPDDKSGNLMLIRVQTTPGFSLARYAMIAGFTLDSVAETGIRLDKHVVDTIRGN